MASNKKWERAQTFHLDTSHSNNLGQLRSALEAEKHPVYICVLSVSPSHQNPRQARVEGMPVGSSPAWHLQRRSEIARSCRQRPELHPGCTGQFSTQLESSERPSWYALSEMAHTSTWEIEAENREPKVTCFCQQLEFEVSLSYMRDHVLK